MSILMPDGSATVVEFDEGALAQFSKLIAELYDMSVGAGDIETESGVYISLENIHEN